MNGTPKSPNEMTTMQQSMQRKAVCPVKTVQPKKPQIFTQVNDNAKRNDLWHFTPSACGTLTITVSTVRHQRHRSHLCYFETMDKTSAHQHQKHTYCTIFP